MHINDDLTIASVCAASNYAVIVRFQQPQTVEVVLPLLDPLHASLACDDPAALAGLPGKTCFIIRLGPELCCSDADSYFRDLGMPVASTDIPHPETPCSCETHWTQNAN